MHTVDLNSDMGESFGAYTIGGDEEIIKYVTAANVACGLLADHVFEPMMRGNGILADSIGRVISTGEGRGIGLMLILAGLFMVAIALVLGGRKSIREIEVINCGYELKNVKE
jgi:hypothetical protein